MIISRKRSQNHPPLHFMNEELSPTRKITLLGVTITNTLTWTLFISGLAKKTAKRLFILGRSRNILPLQARVTVYKAFIRPLMEYASPIWSGAGITSLKLLDRIQKKALRLLKIYDPLAAGIYPLEHRRKVASLCTLYRHYFLEPSFEISQIIPAVSGDVRVTRSTASSHPYLLNIRYHSRKPSSIFPHTSQEQQ